MFKRNQHKSDKHETSNSYINLTKPTSAFELRAKLLSSKHEMDEKISKKLFESTNSTVMSTL